MNKIIIAVLFAALIASCSVTKEWTGNSMPRDNNATFGQFSGKQHFKMALFGADTLSQFRYRFDIEKGSVQILVKQGNKTILDLKDITSLDDKLLLENNGIATIDIFLRGKSAGGLYNMTITKAD